MQFALQDRGLHTLRRLQGRNPASLLTQKGAVLWHTSGMLNLAQQNTKCPDSLVFPSLTLAYFLSRLCLKAWVGCAVNTNSTVWLHRHCAFGGVGLIAERKQRHKQWDSTPVSRHMSSGCGVSLQAVVQLATRLDNWQHIACAVPCA
jgi:hypothetical protein